MSTSLYYNFDNLPNWGSDSPPGFGTGAVQSGEVAPWSQNPYSGYDARIGRLSDSHGRRSTALAHSNGNFCDGRFKFPLFIERINIDFGLAGSQAQSQLTRDFYPHNMVLPGFQLRGRCYDQTSYGELCEFVHAQQRRGLQGNGQTVTYQGKNYSLPLIQLYIQGGTYPKISGGRSGAGVNHNGQVSPNQTLKGQHKPILCLGYIMTMPRQHQTGDYAPRWTVSFMVSNMLIGPYQDNIGTIVEQSNWIAFLTGTNIPNVLTGVAATNYSADKATLAFNKQVLQYAAQASGNISSLGFSGGSGGGNPSGSNAGGGSWSHGLVTDTLLNQIGSQHGWSGQQITDWEKVIAQESDGTLTDTNPSSGAYGIAQFINGAGEYAQYGGDANTVQGQVTAMGNYIAQRYGNPSAAWAHEQANNWY